MFDSLLHVSRAEKLSYDDAPLNPLPAGNKSDQPLPPV
jgi:hypothetical protein